MSHFYFYLNFYFSLYLIFWVEVLIVVSDNLGLVRVIEVVPELFDIILNLLNLPFMANSLFFLPALAVLQVQVVSPAPSAAKIAALVEPQYEDLLVNSYNYS